MQPQLRYLYKCRRLRSYTAFLYKNRYFKCYNPLFYLPCLRDYAHRFFSPREYSITQQTNCVRDFFSSQTLCETAQNRIRFAIQRFVVASVARDTPAGCAAQTSLAGFGKELPCLVYVKNSVETLDEISNITVRIKIFQKRHKLKRELVNNVPSRSGIFTAHKLAFVHDLVLAQTAKSLVRLAVKRSISKHISSNRSFNAVLKQPIPRQTREISAKIKSDNGTESALAGSNVENRRV